MEWLPGEPLMSRDNVDSMRVPNVASGTLPGLAALGIEPRRWRRWRRAIWAQGFNRARLDRWRRAGAGRECSAAIARCRGAVDRSERRLAMQLVIGNKNYSSWSMRPWVLMRQLGLPFEEVQAALRLRAGLAPSGRRWRASAPPAACRCWCDDGFAVWDSLAIVEYLHERFPGSGVWPAEAGTARPRPQPGAPRCTPASARCAATAR